MISVESMRTSISKLYDSWIWRERVKKMPDKQVMAIYYKSLESGKFNKKGTPGRKPRQITLFDLYPEVMKNGRS